MKKLIISVLIVSILLCSCGKTSPRAINLMYHEVSDDIFSPSEELFVSPENFEKQLKYLGDKNIETVFASDSLTQGGTFAVITFDDGYEGIYKNAFPLLKKYNMRATVFLITSAIGQQHHLTEEQIREMSESGLIEFGSHTVTHRKLAELDDDEITAELGDSAEIISELTGKPVTSLAYPNGSYDSRVEKIAQSLGYKVGYTVSDSKSYSGVYEQPRYTVWRESTEYSFGRYVSNPFEIK